MWLFEAGIWGLVVVAVPAMLALWITTSIGEALARRVRREWPEAKSALRELFR